MSHLWNKTCHYEQPATSTETARCYTVEIEFGLHTFTRARKTGESPVADLLYSDARETRVFDFERYELSKLLPCLVEELPRRKCYHTGKGNFFTVEVITREHQAEEYFVFFESSRTKRKSILRLFVQSAYVRSAGRLKRKPIGFYVVLFNTLHNKPIRVPI